MRVHRGVLAALVAAACGKVNEVDSDGAPPDNDADDSVEIVCAAGFDAWFAAGFEFPDGGYLGTADFPSSPWRVTGALSPQDGGARAAGVATAVANQTIAFAGKVRLRAVFTPLADDGRVELFFNADDGGDDGLAVEIDAATGELSARESGRSLGATSLGGLDPDTAYFIEATTDGTQLVVTLATENFASVPAAAPIGQLTSTALQGDSAGTFAGLRFAGGGGSVDNLTVARCGRRPPAYEREFFDDFERADSETIGSVLIPSTPWQDDGANTDIFVGTLLVTNGGVVTADAGQHYPATGLRMRTSARFADNSWLLFGVNDDLTASGFGTTLDIFRGDDTEVFVEYGGPPSESFPVSLDTATVYFVELAVDGTFGSATMRTTGFDGPVLWTLGSDSVPIGAEANMGVNLGAIAPGPLNIEAFVVELYTPPAD